MSEKKVSIFVVAEALYKHRCVSVCGVQIFLRVNKTSTEARLAPGSFEVDYKQQQKSTLRVQICSAWSKFIFLNFTTSATPVQETHYRVFDYD
jgi:hypothetical protein